MLAQTLPTVPAQAVAGAWACVFARGITAQSLNSRVGSVDSSVKKRRFVPTKAREFPMIRILTILAVFSLAAPALADGHASGDAAAGEKAFKKCKSCHKIESPEGEMFVKGGKTGPNLYGLLGRQPGAVEDFRYGNDLVAAGETVANGWTEAEFIAYVADPKAWLKDKLGKNAKSKMSFKLKKEKEAADVWAFILSQGPAAE